MSKGFFNSLSNLVSDSVYVVARAGVAVVSCGLSEIYLQESGHESPMERRERKEERLEMLELQKEYLCALSQSNSQNNGNKN